MRSIWIGHHQWFPLPRDIYRLYKSRLFHASLPYCNIFSSDCHPVLNPPRFCLLSKRFFCFFICTRIIRLPSLRWKLDIKVDNGVGITLKYARSRVEVRFLVGFRRCSATARRSLLTLQNSDGEVVGSSIQMARSPICCDWLPYYMDHWKLLPLSPRIQNYMLGGKEESFIRLITILCIGCVTVGW